MTRWLALVTLAALGGACTSSSESAHAPDAGGHDAATGGSGGATEAGLGGSGGSAAGDAGGAAGAPAKGPTRYPVDAVLSPVSPSVVERLRAIAQTNPNRKNDVFMKVGDSHTVNKNFLYCFAGPAEPSYQLDLSGHDALLPSIEYFRKGDAQGATPFDRVSLAASVGKSANWAIAGAPTPVEQETSALDPRFAFVGYGTNDMQLGITFASAAFPFYTNLNALLDGLEAAGIVPLVTGLPPRSDDATAATWVPTYDLITRGIAEARQLPYFSMYFATRALPNLGLGPDGLHGNVYSAGGAQGCVFTPAGLGYGYDVRNLYSMQRLDVAKHVVVDSAAAPDATVPAVAGSGTPSDPFVIDALPFAHSSDTTSSSTKSIDVYTGCSSSADESGPERWYSLKLTEPTPVRVMLFDRNGVDVDIQLLSGGTDASACIARNDRMLEKTLAAGSYSLVVDSFVSSGKTLSGPYLLVVVRCDPADAACK